MLEMRKYGKGAASAASGNRSNATASRYNLRAAPVVASE
jgi:hypothetical protein